MTVLKAYVYVLSFSFPAVCVAAAIGWAVAGARWLVRKATS